MRVLVACEFTGIVRDAFTSRGHEAYSCDVLPNETSGLHITDDVLNILDRGWDLMIAHPPCTYLALSGICWLYGGKGSIVDERRWLAMERGAKFFRTLLEASIPRIAIENPRMHIYGKKAIGRGPDQEIQPWQFGHGETKATCFWLKNLPPLRPTSVVVGRQSLHQKYSRHKDAWYWRSRTYPGIAMAMAEQWGEED